MNSLRNIIKGEYGVCSFDTVKDHLINCRNIDKIPENPQSIILFTFPYKVKEEKPVNISRYAAVPDYHPIIMESLENQIKSLKTAYPNNKFVAFADNSPIPEVFAASVAGLGVMGKNGLLITDEYGSFVFIGEIVTDLPLATQNKITKCENCGLCLKKCPVSLNKERCLSAVTQKKQELSKEEEALIKENGYIWGCDICSEICPMNKNKKISHIKAFTENYRNEYVLSEDITGRAFAWRGEKVIMRNHNILYNK